jgi:Predicted DNA-binding protein with an HTH domain
MITIKVPDEIDREFAALAAEKSLSKAELMEIALREYLEDQADLKRADEALEAYLKGVEKASSLEEVSRRLGLD